VSQLKVYDFWEQRDIVQRGGDLPKDINQFVREYYADLPLVLKALDIVETSIICGGIKVIRKVAVKADPKEQNTANIIAMLLKLHDMKTGYGMVEHVDTYEVMEDEKCIVIIFRHVANKSVKKRKRKDVKDERSEC
jgi:hypothetical protein